MKYLLTGILTCSFSFLIAQTDFNEVFAAGVEDAEQFTTDYLSPVSESAVFNMATGWYNSADAKPLGGFEISVIGSITGFKNKQDKKSFILDPNDYENLDFVDNSGTARPVSSALGDLEGIRVFVEVEVGPGLPPERREFELPTGLSAEGLDFIPSGYLQGSVGLIKGTEIKARFLPKIEYEGASVGIIGFGLQHDFTKLLPADKILPVAISAVIGYTKISGDYDLTEVSTIGGSDQRLESDISTWAFNAVVSTKLPIINFYGGLGYVTGKSVTDVLGDYTVGIGPFARTETDPFSITQKTNGVTGNVGAKLKLGFFRLNADYTLAEFNTLTFGLNFGFR
ncbi:hypothetical protein BFP77_05495 [Maribacter sp. 4U21]|uniref:DUF6588 family protein n=1 Tax=Maribacter sp. 4U21 TaxID=1889779 RepID=UPI000C152796|nr:DUF6588 family protein [Maribacter sp. 4U21]PIB29607.1 hypothetical protein BFP77_05495 [Maribacter sp. 4U21]